MPIIDADTHVEEPEEAWAFMDEAEQRYRPVKGYFDETDPNAATGSGFWLIDDGDLPEEAIQKITYDNPRKFYGL